MSVTEYNKASKNNLNDYKLFGLKEYRLPEQQYCVLLQRAA